MINTRHGKCKVIPPSGGGGLRRALLAASVTALLTVLLTALLILPASAAPVYRLPVTLTQPDGSVVYCFASGDEYFNYNHDDAGNLIIQNPVTGWYEYVKSDNGVPVPNGVVVPSGGVVAGVTGGQESGQVIGEGGGLIISGGGFGEFDAVGDVGNVAANYSVIEDFSDYASKKRAERYELMNPPEKTKSGKTRTAEEKGQLSGDINSIVIFIRFSDDPEFVNNPVNGGIFADKFMERLNSTSGESMYGYFHEVSNGKIFINNTLYPKNDGGTAYISYQDTYPKSHFQPASASNPGGYIDVDKSLLEEGEVQDSQEREHALLKRVIDYINSTNQIPKDVNYDLNNDKKIDNIMFIVGTETGGWSDLLWSHQWSLGTPGYYAYINGLQVWKYSFDMVSSVVPNFFNTDIAADAKTFDISTLYHETLHVFGFLDLYVYENSYRQGYPVANYDIMSSSISIHPLMYSKLRWGDSSWVDGRIGTLKSAKGKVTLTQSTENGTEETAWKLPMSETGYDKDIYFEYKAPKRHGGIYSAFFEDEAGLIVYETDDTKLYNCYPLRDGGFAVFVLREKYDAHSFTDDGYIPLSNGRAIYLDNIDMNGDKVTFNYNYDYGIGEPSLDISAGSADNKVSLTLSHDITAGGFGDVSIYYTTDGSEPDINSAKYTAPFEATGEVTLKARVVATTVGGQEYSGETAIFYIDTTDIRTLTLYDEKRGLYIDSKGIIYLIDSYRDYAVVASGQTYPNAESGTTNLVIPSMVFIEGKLYSVGRINSNAFRNNTIITTIDLPKNLSTIYVQAFYNCPNLEAVELPPNLSYIGDAVFGQCGKLTSFSISEDSKHFYTDEDGVLLSKDKKTLVAYPSGAPRSEYTVPDTVTKIADLAFCKAGLIYPNYLKSIIIPESVKSIGDSAFYNCYRLSSVYILGDVDYLGANTFEACYYLQNIFFAGNLPETVGSGVFIDCSSLKRVWLYPGTSGWGETFEGIPCSEMFTAEGYTYRGGFLIGGTERTAQSAFIPAADVTLKFYSDGDTNTVADASAYVGTGFVIEPLYNGVSLGRLTVCVSGDMNGDGLIDVTDAIKWYAAAGNLAGNTLTGNDLVFADINGDGDVDEDDLLMCLALCLD